MSETYEKILKETPLEIKLKVAFQLHDYENWKDGVYSGDAEKYVEIAMKIFKEHKKL